MAVVLADLIEPSHTAVITCEYWSPSVTNGEVAVSASSRSVSALPIEIVPVGPDLALVRQAAIYKATRTMAYADCFAAALAKLRKAELVTGDEEF